MRAETKNTVSDIRNSLVLLKQRMDWDTAKHRLEEFDAMIEDPDLWDDQAKAQKLMRDRQMLIDALETCTGIETDLTDNIELIELGEAEDDQDVVEEAETAITALAKLAAKKELEALLNGEADGNDTFLEINSGAGGTESCDWANMLARMYVRWAEQHGYKVELMSETAGDEAGIKSAAYRISGLNAYGWLKSESGVHRLVRISPFDSAAKRHTSFSSIWVYPVVDENIEIEINPVRHSPGHLPFQWRRWPACEHNGQRGAYHPHSNWYRCDQFGKVPTPEPRERDGRPEIPALPDGIGKTKRLHSGSPRCKRGRWLGQSDPFLCVATLSDGQRPALKIRNLGHQRCSGWRSGWIDGGDSGAGPFRKIPVTSPRRYLATHRYFGGNA